jgi:predicted methyltransferase
MVASITRGEIINIYKIVIVKTEEKNIFEKLDMYIRCMQKCSKVSEESVSSEFYCEDGGRKLFRNFRIYLPDYAASHSTSE